MSDVSFEDVAVVSCGTMRLELNYLMEEGWGRSSAFAWKGGEVRNIRFLMYQSS